MEYYINSPADKNELSMLRAGDKVYLSGIVYTARDQAHKKIIETLENGEELPFEIRGSTIYYVGPTPEKPGTAIGSAGPTTSGRMDKFSPSLLNLGNAIMIGKGKRNEEVKKAVERNGAVYLAAPGGAGALMAGCIEKSTVIAFNELGCEAVRELVVKNMPLTVAIDTLGNDIYEIGPENFLQNRA